MATQKKNPAKPSATAKPKAAEVDTQPQADGTDVEQQDIQSAESDMDAEAQTDGGDTPVSGDADAGFDGEDADVEHDDDGTDVVPGVDEVNLEDAGFDVDCPLIGVVSTAPEGFWRCGIHFEYRAARVLNILADDDVRLDESGVSVCQRYITQAVADRLQAEPHLEVDVLETE